MNVTGDSPTPEDRELAERGRLLIAAAVAEERAPLALRERVEADRARQAVSGRRRRRRIVPAAATALAASVTAVVIAIGGSQATATVGAVAAVSQRGHEQPPPAHAEDRPKQLQASVDGVPFPYWEEKFGWRATGAREDTVSGRHTTTVFYSGKSNAEVGYSIVAGKALDVPDGRRVTVDGTTLTVMDDGPRQIVTWRRGGRTCVISAPDAVPTRKLLSLAAWDAGATSAA